MNTVKEKIKWIDWGIAGRPLPGQAESGDLALVECDSRRALMAAIDGLGHGGEAHAAAELAAKILMSCRGDSVIDLVKRCHEALVSTRGAVMTLASIDLEEETMTWVGVGNVEARLFRGRRGMDNPPERMLLRGGLIGLKLPPVQATTLRLTPGDLLVFATDGIQAGFDEAIPTAGPPQQIAEDILSRHARQVDDALVLAVRYAGEADMKKHEQKVAQRYATTLQQYVAGEQEADLEAAYDLGREAIAGGLGVLDMARVHLEARERLLSSQIGGRNQARVSRLAGTFYLQSLSPFEATHRGFNGTNAELAKRNRELEVEIAERRRAEADLLKSKNHYRELFDEARLMEQNLRNLSNQVLHAQEEERRRISRELHDEIGQAMTAISINIQALRHSRAKRAEFFRREIARTQRLLQRTMEMVHRFARELRPAMLDELGLLPALRSHLKSFKARTGLQVSFSADDRAEQLSNDQKIAVFRVAQESLTNVARHARARHVNISIRQVGGELSMEITDDGRSFRTDPATAGRKKQRLGLLGMQERARLLGGQFTISPAPDRGTVVRLSIPVIFHPQRTRRR